MQNQLDCLPESKESLNFSNKLALSGKHVTFAPNIFLEHLGFKFDHTWSVVKGKRKIKISPTTDINYFKNNFRHEFAEWHEADLTLKKNWLLRKLRDLTNSLQINLDYKVKLGLLFFLYYPLELEVKIEGVDYPIYTKDILIAWLGCSKLNLSKMQALLIALEQLDELIDFVGKYKDRKLSEEQRLEEKFLHYCKRFKLPQQTTEQFLNGVSKVLLEKLGLREAITSFSNMQKKVMQEKQDWDLFTSLLESEYFEDGNFLLKLFSPTKLAKADIDQFLNQGSVEQINLKQKNWNSFISKYYKRSLVDGHHEEFLVNFPRLPRSLLNCDLAELLLQCSSKTSKFQSSLNSVAQYVFFINGDARSYASINCNNMTRIRPNRTFGYYIALIELERRAGIQTNQVEI